MNPRRLLGRISRGDVSNVSFGDFVRLLEHLGFAPQRRSGSHHIYSHPAIPELVNVQEVAGEAKPYQVRQVLRLIERYNLKLEDES
jgi:predicted RNA binding protein YcfA (HicA-like mRNA interferase family)